MPRTTTKTSTVYSKTTPKMILKKSTQKGPQKDEASERRMLELRGEIVSRSQKQPDVRTGVAASSVATYAQKAGGSISFAIPNASTNQAVLKTAEVFKVAPKAQQPVHQSLGSNPAKASPPTGPRLQPQGDLRGGPTRSTYGSQAQDRRPQQSIHGMNTRPTDSKLSLRLPLPIPL
jgi:hypothetical protein